MNSAEERTPLFQIGDWVSFQYGPAKVSAKVVEDRGSIGVHGRRLYRVQLDEKRRDASTFEMPENELETALPPVRQPYRVRYVRQGKTNHWRATTIRGQLRKGVKAEGAVGYTSAFWGREREHGQKSAIVTVLLEVDSRFGEPGFHLDPNIRRESAERAGVLADEMFLSRHPRAHIERDPPA